MPGRIVTTFLNNLIACSRTPKDIAVAIRADMGLLPIDIFLSMKLHAQKYRHEVLIVNLSLTFF